MSRTNGININDKRSIHAFRFDRVARYSTQDSSISLLKSTLYVISQLLPERDGAIARLNRRWNRRYGGARGSGYIDLISKITAVFSHRRDRSFSADSFPSVRLSLGSYTHISRSKRGEKAKEGKRKQERAETRRVVSIDSPAGRDMLRECRSGLRLESDLPTRVARIRIRECTRRPKNRQNWQKVL